VFTLTEEERIVVELQPSDLKTVWRIHRRMERMVARLPGDTLGVAKYKADLAQVRQRLIELRRKNAPQ
jgi:hypothetical protein